MAKVTKKEAALILDKLAEAFPDARCELDHENPFQLLIATILSAQTTDKMVNRVTPDLFAAYPDYSSLAVADTGRVEELIRNIGLYRTKAKNIIGASRLMMENFDGQVPDNMKDLTSLPGVGRKTANVVLSNAFGLPAIAVDTHVFRVSKRIGLSAGKDVGQCEKDLQKLLERSSWNRAHHLLIFQGRYICKARGPLCSECSIRDHCRFYQAGDK